MRMNSRQNKSSFTILSSSAWSVKWCWYGFTRLVVKRWVVEKEKDERLHSVIKWPNGHRVGLWLMDHEILSFI